MPKITDTYQLAYACCETILKELNRFPTIDLIRERIGVNSPNTIKKAMNDWTEAFAKQYIEQQKSKINCPEVPNLLTDAVYQLWKHTVKEAGQLANAKVDIVQSQLKELQDKVEQQQAALLTAQQELANETCKLEAAQAQTKRLIYENERNQKTLLEYQQREQALSNRLEEQGKREVALKEQHNHRLQQEQAWMQRRILEERQLEAEKWTVKQQQLEERLDFLKSQAKQAQQSQVLMQTHNQQLLTEILQLKKQQNGESLTTKLPKRFKHQPRLK